MTTRSRIGAALLALAGVSSGWLSVLASAPLVLWGSGLLFGRPGNSRQSGEGRALEDLADVVESDDEFLEPVQGRALLPAQ